MKLHFDSRYLTLCACVTILSNLGSVATAAEKVSARTVAHSGSRSSSIVSNKVAEVVVPESVFVDAADRKDPFFPDAEYRKQSKPAPPKQFGGDAILNQLKLTGFGGIGDKRWAMINGISIYLNESSKIVVNGKPHKIVCLEMQENSVTVGFENGSARRELKLGN